MAGNLNRDDLFLLMQSYENTVKSNTTLLEQQRTLIAEHKDILTKQIELIHNTDKITNRQTSIINVLGKVADKLAKLEEQNNRDFSSLAKDINTELQVQKLDNLHNHNQLKTKFIWIGAGISTVVLALLGLVERVWSKLSVLDSIAKSLGIK